MRNSIKISTIAVLAAMLTSMPVSAAGLLGGGNGLLGLGGSDSGSGSGTTGGLVNVGGTGGLVNVGGSGGTVNVLPSTGTSGSGGVGGLVGGLTGGNDTPIVTTGGTSVSVDTGNLLGGNDADHDGTNVNVTTDLLGTTGSGSGATGNTTANVHLGGSGSNGGLLGVLGSNNDPTTADVNIGGTGGTNANVLLDLFGNGDNPNASVHVNTGTGGLAGLPLLNVGDLSLDLALDLFGPGNGGGGNGGGGNGGGGNGGGGNGGGGNGGGGNGGGGGGNGGGGGSGAGGTGGTGSGGPLGGGATGGPGYAYGGLVASLEGGLACFTPDSAQIAKLIGRHAYTNETFASWRGVTGIKVIDLRLCDRSGKAIARQGNIARLQAYLASNPAIQASLKKAGSSARSVVGVDKSGRTLIIYVM